MDQAEWFWNSDQMAMQARAHLGAKEDQKCSCLSWLRIVQQLLQFREHPFHQVAHGIWTALQVISRPAGGCSPAELAVSDLLSGPASISVFRGSAGHHSRVLVHWLAEAVLSGSDSCVQQQYLASTGRS